MKPSAISHQLSAKIKKRNDLSATLTRLRRKGKRIVFTNGCFDILHVGHVDYLSKAKRLGDVLVVGLNSDDSVRRLKSARRPLNREKDRARVLSSMCFVDFITIFDEDTPKRLIEKLSPDVLVKGGDWKKKDIVGADFVRSRGGRVVTVPFVKGYSTTSIIKKIAKS